MREHLRYNGKLLSAKVFTKGGRWFVSIAVELGEVITPLSKTNKAVGIDLGITDLATLSDGTKIQASKPLKKQIKETSKIIQTAFKTTKRL